MAEKPVGDRWFAPRVPTRAELKPEAVTDHRLALYTTVHPGSLDYVAAWLRSASTQTDEAFDIWIGVDQVRPAEVVEAMGRDPGVSFVEAGPGATPTEIRQVAIERMVDRYPAVVFTDSDDLLERDRIAAARRSLFAHDVSGCAMRIVDRVGRDTGVALRPPCRAGQNGWDLLVRANCFGLGNSAYRSETLRSCLPIPRECVMEDWFLAVRAWTQGWRLGFEATCGMAYRQHGSNMTSVLPPFSEADVGRETQVVLEHYALALAHIPELRPVHRRALERARDDVHVFAAAMESRERRRRYVAALNRLPPTHVWFDCVAHPDLEPVWRA